MADAALQMEVAALEAERQVLGADTRLQGVIRVASSEPLSAGLLTRVLGAFLVEHPDIDVELIVANRHADLSRREADLALRATAEPPATLIGRELARVDYAVYARLGTYGGCAELPALAGERWVGLDDSRRIAAFAGCAAPIRTCELHCAAIRWRHWSRRSPPASASPCCRVLPPHRMRPSSKSALR